MGFASLLPCAAGTAAVDRDVDIMRSLTRALRRLGIYEGTALVQRSSTDFALLSWPDRMPQASARKAAFVGFACASMVLTWQFLTVRYNYHGDWSALFCTGALADIPPVVAREHPYQFHGVVGWDGQWYHAMAHHPLLRREADSSID